MLEEKAALLVNQIYFWKLFFKNVGHTNSSFRSNLRKSIKELNKTWRQNQRLKRTLDCLLSTFIIHYVPFIPLLLPFIKSFTRYLYNKQLLDSVFVISRIIIKSTSFSIVNDLKNSYFPLINLSSFLSDRQLVNGQFNLLSDSSIS